jgi:hypothetical protein
MAEPRTFKLLPPPLMHGDDIAKFQRDLTSCFASWAIHKHVADDEVYGWDTRDAAQVRSQRPRMKR